MNEVGAKYTVVDEFAVKDKMVLVLDRDRSIEDFNTSKIVVVGKSFSYEVTHNRRWVVISDKVDFRGKELVFS